jgi:hypothetical protein
MNYIGSTHERFVAGTVALRRVHEGQALAAAAQSVLEQLPPEPVALLAASVEGAVLAGVCAAQRSEGSTWERVNLLVDGPAREVPIAFVEPTEPGAAWRAAVAARYPGAAIIVPFGAAAQALDCRAPVNAAATA